MRYDILTSRPSDRDRTPFIPKTVEPNPALLEDISARQSNAAKALERSTDPKLKEQAKAHAHVVEMVDEIYRACFPERNPRVRNAVERL